MTADQSTEPDATPRSLQLARWGALGEAILQDFLDDLPDPLHPWQLASRLILSRAVVYYHITHGHLVARRVNGAWEIDHEANRDWIAESLRTISERRKRLRASASPNAPTTIIVSDPDALTQLWILVEAGLSPSEAVEHALRRFSDHGIP